MPLFVAPSILMTYRLILRDGVTSDFVTWQGKLNGTLASQEGFISLELLNTPGVKNEWVIVERFDTSQNALEWEQSAGHAILFKQLEDLSLNRTITSEKATADSFKGGITQVIVTKVQPGKELSYRNWSAKIHEAEASIEGFRGVYLQSPAEGRGEHWITLLQFDTAEHLDLWLESPLRRSILKEGEPFISSMESHRVISPYAGWFANIAKTGDLPSVWKQTMLVLLVLFPIVMLELQYLNPYTEHLGKSLSTFIGNAISVSLISFPMMPIALWALSFWLNPKSPWLNGLGLAIVLILYLVEIALFSAFN